MNDELPSDLRPIVDYFGLPDIGVVEKDWHVVKALAVIAAIDATPLRLVFGGGTALSRAHRLIRRMSEDIDLKIIAKEKPSRGALRQLREAVAGCLRIAGFHFNPGDHITSENQSRHITFRLPYTPRGETSLRAEIKIELHVGPLHGETVDLPVRSFVAEALQRAPEITHIACVPVLQTAAEKFVALTRRVAAECDLAESKRDSTLVRHIYDLHVVRGHYNAADAATLAREIMPHDAKTFAGKSSAYGKNPVAETQKAITALQSDAYYARRFTEFQGTMVYGERVEYDVCLATVKDLARRIHG